MIFLQKNTILLLIVLFNFLYVIYIKIYNIAIVIKETATKIFIVPCSSAMPRKDKNGNIYPEFEVGSINDVFQRNTVVMLFEAKY